MQHKPTVLKHSRLVAWAKTVAWEVMPAELPKVVHAQCPFCGYWAKLKRHGAVLLQAQDACHHLIVMDGGWAERRYVEVYDERNDATIGMEQVAFMSKEGDVQ